MIEIFLFITPVRGHIDIKKKIYVPDTVGIGSAGLSIDGNHYYVVSVSLTSPTAALTCATARNAT